MSLHLLPVLQKIYEFYGYTETFKSFCKERSEVLETIGDVNFETAIACLKDVSEGRSKRPERELDGAIMSLRTAYEAFCSASAKAKILWGDDYGRKALYPSKASVTALLVASCYKYQKEQKLERSFLEKLKLSFSAYTKALVEDDRYNRRVGWWFPELDIINAVFDGDDAGTKLLIENLHKEMEILNSLLRDRGVQSIESIKPSKGLKRTLMEGLE